MIRAGVGVRNFEASTEGLESDGEAAIATMVMMIRGCAIKLSYDKGGRGGPPLVIWTRNRKNVCHNQRGAP